MAKVCTGCGLTTDDDDALIVAVSGEFPYTDACGASGGGKVYCSPNDGKLYVDPPPMFRQWRFVNEISGTDGTEGDDLSDYGIKQSEVAGGPVTKTFTAPGGVITNPSKCQDMQLYIEIGIQHALFTVDSGGPASTDSAVGDIQIEAYYSLSGGITAFEQPGGHQHWGAEAQNGTQLLRVIYRFDSAGAFLDLSSNADGTSPYVLAPGASVTLTSIAKIIVIRYGTTGAGRVKLENWRNTIRVTGWAGA